MDQFYFFGAELMRRLLFVLLISLLGFATIAADQSYPIVCSTVDMNTTADQPLNFSGYANVIVRRATMTAATISLTTAAGGIYTQTSKGGSAVVPATQVYSTLTTSAKFLDLTLQAPATTTALNGQTVYFSLTTPQGQAATARLCVYGDIIN